MRKIKENYINKLYILGLLFFVVLCVIIVAILKYPSKEVNYHNSDATWHTLLTIESYNETKVSKHLFLPIVSLGNDTDKGIPWGSTISDKDGNFYYTSFSAAGYFTPWLFFKIFHLPVCEKSLYVFNTFLFVVSACLWSFFLTWIYKEKKFVKIIPFIGVILYIFSPEILHGMGIVYWHQSLMQVTFLLQLMAYYQYRKNNSKKGKIVFYLFAFLNPYIEWTGYVTNVGFAIADFLSNYKEKPREALKGILILGGITLFSFLVFIFHYLLRVRLEDVLQLLSISFVARSVEIPVALTSVLGGYLKSFLYIWVFLIILIIWNIFSEKKLEFSKGLWMFLFAFPILENVVVKHHALLYSYDKMKGIFLLSFTCCELVYQILKKDSSRKNIFVLVLLTGFIAVFNFRAYINDKTYMWETNYREDNLLLKDYINVKYPSSSVLLSSEADVRGYLNLLFKRGMYEYADLTKLVPIAKEKEKQYIVVLCVQDKDIVGVIDLAGAFVYDIVNQTVSRITIINGVVSEVSLTTEEKDYSLTDIVNVASVNNIFVLNRKEDILLKLLLGNKILIDDNEFKIQNIDYDELLIRVTLDKDVSDYLLATTLKIE